MGKNIFLAALLCIFYSCGKKEIIDVKVDIYAGKIIQKSVSYYVHVTGERDTFTRVDSLDVRVMMMQDSFCILGINDQKGCKGAIKKTTPSITFSSEDCSCWCDCNPLIDCGGNLLLGRYELLITNESQLDFEGTYSNYGGVYKKTVTLKKE